MHRLEDKRSKVKDITLEIMRLVKQRLDLVKEIGAIKQELGLSIIDKQAEDELRASVLELSNSIGLDKGFALRLLNILIRESIRLQNKDNANKVITPTIIFSKAKELESKGKEIIHLEVGEPDLDPPEQVRHAMLDAINNKRYRYTQPSGIKELRAKIAEHLNSRFNSRLGYDDIIVTNGGRFGVYLAISLLNEGDEIIVIDPSWPAYKDIADMRGVNVRVIHTSIEQGWDVDINMIKDEINASSKMLVLNYPNNPTGKILDEHALDKIVALAKDYGLIILSDEVYSYYSFKRFKSILEYDDVDYILVSSFSKAYAMTGFRIGFVASNNSNLIKSMQRHQAIAYTSIAEPIQYAAMKALEQDTSNYSSIMKDRIDFLSNRLRALPLLFYKPDGGMYIFAKVEKDNFDASRFAYYMLEHGLAITPGDAFGNYNDHIRLSACNDKAILEKGIDILKQGLEDY